MDNHIPENRTKEQLIKELKALRQRVAELEKSAAQSRLAVIEDIAQESGNFTERKQVKEALHESELRYRTLFHNVPVGIGIATYDGRILVHNKAMLEMTGYSEEEIKQINLRDTYQNPEQREQLLECLQREGSVHNFEVVKRRKDGTLYYASLTITPFTLGGEKVLLTVAEDITERKQVAEALRASRDYLEKLTNSMWDAIFSVKMPERIIEWANDSFRLIGYEPEECVGRTTEFLYPDKREFLDFGNKLKKAIAAGKDILHAEQSLKRKSGEVFPAEITITFFKEKGEVVHVTSIVRDITERKQAERELRRSESQLRLLSQRMISAQEEERTRISRELHDQLGQELTAIKIEAMSLADKIGNSSLGEQAWMLVSLVEKLSETVRHTSANLRPAMLDKLGLIKAVQWYAEDFERQTGISCPIEVIGVKDEDMANRNEIATAAYRILQEALTNVLRHSQATQAKIQLSDKSDKLVMCISDNGVGMDMNQLADGSALGLLGMRERAHLVGGNIRIKSHPDKGTKVTIYLPLR